MRTFAQSRHCAITGLAEGCDFGRRTSVARTANHARGSCGRLPTSRPVHDLGCAVPAAPQCGREVSVGPLPRPGTPLGTVRRPPGLHARRLCAAPRPNPAEVHAAPSPGEPVDLVLCVHIRDVLRPWLCAARHRRRHQLHRAPDRHRSGPLCPWRAGRGGARHCGWGRLSRSHGGRAPGVGGVSLGCVSDFHQRCGIGGDSSAFAQGRRA